MQILVLWAAHFLANSMIPDEIMLLLWTCRSTIGKNNCHGNLIRFPDLFIDIYFNKT